MTIWESLLMRVFLWSGSKLFPFVSVFAPSGDDGTVKAVHFAEDERALMESCREILSEDAD